MGGWWVSELWSISPVLMISWAAWVIISITLHELAHGWAAISKGDRTPIEYGRMTWNPIVHMGQFSLIAFALLGIAWGSMPVNEHRLRGRHAPAFVAAAGPAMNLALALGCVLCMAVWDVLIAKGLLAALPQHVVQNVSTVLYAGGVLNLVLMMFNLLPIPPLDGARIATDFSPAYGRLFEGQQGQFVGLALFIGMWLFGFGKLFGAAAISFVFASDLLASLFI
jgi:Zn-dependent protease